MENKKNISKSLYEVLIKELSQNKWKEHDKFYSIRQVSIKFSINLNTVLKVFQALEKEGFLYSVKGKGYYIKKGYDLAVGNTMTPILNTFRFGQNSENFKINFANGAPPKDFFPYKEYKNIMSEILENSELSKQLLGYQNIQGLESLRKTLVLYLKKFNILTCKNNILICSSTQATLELICSTLGTYPKKTFLISKPTYQNAMQLIKNLCKIETIDLKNDGWDIEELEALLNKKKIHFVYVMSNFQNPTGVTWKLEKKIKLIELAKKYDFFIVEDDYLSDFDYNNSSPISLKSLDKYERVFYIKTFSKSVMPGIGITLFIPPKNFITYFSLNKYFIDTTTSGINQKFLEIFIKNDFLERHIEVLKNTLKKKLDFIIKELEKVEHIKILHIPTGGFFLWLELASYIDEEKFYYKCHLKGVALLPGFIFYPSKQNSSKIRISFINSSFDEIREGVNIIKNILDNCEGVLV